MLGDKEGQDVFQGYGGDEPGEEVESLPYYATLAGVFNLIFAVFLLVSRRMGREIPERIAAKDIALLGIAAHKLSLVGSQDAVTSPIRAPFTELEEQESPNNLEEKPRGRGFQKSIGELLTCQFCLGMWISAALTYGLVLVPRTTRFATSIFAVVTISDFLHQIYKFIQTRA